MPDEKSEAQPAPTRLLAMEEIETSYVEPHHRFIVSLVVGYSPEEDEEVTTPLEALSAALDLITDPDGGPDTNWYVHDRQTKQTHMFEQKEAADGNL